MGIHERIDVEDQKVCLNEVATPTIDAHIGKRLAINAIVLYERSYGKNQESK
jgi:hypothetical protein